MSKLEIKFLDNFFSQTSSEKNFNITDIAVSSARTCYSAKGIITPEESKNWKRKPHLLESIFKSGHHTTLQHTHITMLISGVSRHLVWRVLHSHSFYNSEQVSQRYAKMNLENVSIPKKADSMRWQKFYTERFNDYEKLIELLIPKIESILPKFKKQTAIKKAQELARYLLPQGTQAYLYHTVNILTILRYISLCYSLPEIIDEVQDFAKLLEKNLLELDENLKPLIDFAKKQKVYFPKIDIEKYRKKGIVFDVVGDFDIELNNNYSGILRTSQLVFDEAVIGGFSSYYKLSLSADAQNQRHRRTFAVRPLLQDYFQEDFYIPPIIKENRDILDFYINSVKKSYLFFNQGIHEIGFSEAIYALPNSHLIEIVTREDWASFHHKSQMRLCYNAQQEIFDIVYQQVKKLRDLKILGSDKFLPPCSLRAEIGNFPICPEGERFCGIKVWKLDFNNFIREI